MHDKLFSIQIFQYFRQIPPRVCTLVLFIIIIIGDMWIPLLTLQKLLNTESKKKVYIYIYILNINTIIINDTI